MTDFCSFKAIGADGSEWTIQAEFVKSPFQGHQFVVHRSLSPEDSPWSVSHFPTGTVIMKGETKFLATEDALRKLQNVGADSFNRAAESARKRVSAAVGRLNDGTGTESNPIFSTQFRAGVDQAVSQAVKEANEHGLPQAYDDSVDSLQRDPRLIRPNFSKMRTPMENVTALEELFSLPPYTWLLNGTHSTVYADQSGIFAKDDLEHKRVPVSGPTTFEQVEGLMKQFMPLEEWSKLDIEVNGREYALSKFHLSHNGLPGVQLVVAARHRLTKDASAGFKPTVILTLS